MATPEGWTAGRLGDACALEYGKSLPEHARKPGPFAVFGSNGAVGTHDVALVEGPGIVVGRKGSIGEVVWSSGHFWPIDTTYYVRPSPTVDLSWLYQKLQSLGLRSLNTATGIPGLNRDAASALPICLPPLPEQRKIAAILSSIDETIEKTEAVIEQLQVVKKAIMQELLTRGMPGRHTRFKQTEVGEIPEGWDVVQVGAVCERMFVGIAQAATHAYVRDGGVPIVRTTNVKPNRILRDDMLRISDAFARQMSTKVLRAGDVLSARTGYPGVSALVDESLDGAQCFTLLVSRPGPRLRGQYLVHMMNSVIGERIVQQGQAGGAQQNLNVTVFEQALVPLPPVGEQDEISAIIDEAYRCDSGEGEVLDRVRAVKASLSASLLSGDLRVTRDSVTP